MDEEEEERLDHHCRHLEKKWESKGKRGGEAWIDETHEIRSIDAQTGKEGFMGHVQ